MFINCVEAEQKLPIVSIFRKFLSKFSQKFESGESFSEQGKLRTVNGQDVIVTKGSYTTVEQDGSLVRIDYEADEQGFRVGKLYTVQCVFISPAHFLIIINETMTFFPQLGRHQFQLNQLNTVDYLTSYTFCPNTFF